jgi:hypothetical protein
VFARGPREKACALCALWLLSRKGINQPMKTRALFSVAFGLVAAVIFASDATAQTIIINSVAKTNSGASPQLRFDATGGTGPFVIQRANQVNDPWCSIATAAQGSNVVVGNDGLHAFFRVRDLANAPATRLTVSLSGAAAQTGSTGDGFGTFEVSSNVLTFDIAYRNLSSGTIIAHIHGPADSSGTASPIIDFTSHFVSGLETTNGRIAGSVPLSSADLATILGGRAYVNIHTTNFGGGEIRGQITPTTYRVVLSGAGERPTQVTSKAFGFGVLTLIGNQLSYHITYQGLNGTANNAHIHGPAAIGATASPMFDLLRPTGFGTAGVLSGRTNLTPAQIAAIVDGKTYANIHSTVNPGGEIRGQVLPILGESPFAGELTGFSENPDVTTPASGFVGAALQSNVLSFVVTYKDLKSKATAAHFHGPAVTTNNTGVIQGIEAFHRGTLSTQGVFVGSITLSQANVSNLLAGLIYVNVHTTNHSGGEIRAQLCPTIIPVLANGAQEGVTTPATGYGYVGLVARQFSIGMHYRDLVAPASNAHLHGPVKPPGSTGTLIGFNNANYFAGGLGRSGFFIGSETTTDAIASYIVDGLTYVNIHSTTFPNGEIRGNVLLP